MKCDETKPLGLRCKKVNQVCEYQGINVTWEGEARKKGTTFGRSLQARAKAKKSQIKEQNTPSARRHKSIVKLRSHFPLVGARAPRMLNLC